MSQKFLSASSLSGTSTTRQRIKDDYYATNPVSTELLLEKESFNGSILEPCCGEGHIADVIKSHGYNVLSNDLVNRGYGETFKDFLTDDFEKVDNIITNPPYKHAKAFIERALDLTHRKVAMFCKIQLLEGQSRFEMFQHAPLKTVYVFVRRQTPLPNGSLYNEKGKKWASTMCFAWFVFEHGYEGKPTIDWLI